MVVLRRVRELRNQVRENHVRAKLAIAHTLEAPIVEYVDTLMPVSWQRLFLFAGGDDERLADLD